MYKDVWYCIIRKSDNSKIMCKDVFLIMILDKSTHELIFMSKATIWNPLFLLSIL